MPEIKLHDTVLVEAKHKEKEEDYWGNNTYPGVVVALSSTEVTIKNKHGKHESYQFDGKHYEHSIGQYSDLEFENDIKKAIEDSRAKIKKAEEGLKKEMDWLYDYQNHYSFYNRIKRWVKSNY